MYSITLQDLENYILELIPTLPQLNCLEESFYSFYVCTAVRKFFFFLDPLRTGGLHTNFSVEGAQYVYCGVSRPNEPKSRHMNIVMSVCLVVLWPHPPPGKIKIQDILACGFLDDLLEVSNCTYV